MASSILLVDDEPVFLDSVTRGLWLEGYTDVTAVTRSKDVPALIDAKRFDCAFLDINMPDLDGMDLLKVSKSGAHVPNALWLRLKRVFRWLFAQSSLALMTTWSNPPRPRT